MKSVPQAEDTLLAHMMILVGLQCLRKAPVVVVVAVQRALGVCVGEKRRRGKSGNRKKKMTIANRSGDRLPLATDEGRTCQWWWLQARPQFYWPWLW